MMQVWLKSSKAFARYCQRLSLLLHKTTTKIQNSDSFVSFLPSQIVPSTPWASLIKAVANMLGVWAQSQGTEPVLCLPRAGNAKNPDVTKSFPWINDCNPSYAFTSLMSLYGIIGYTLYLTYLRSCVILAIVGKPYPALVKLLVYSPIRCLFNYSYIVFTSYLGSVV